MATQELGQYVWSSLLLRTERIATPSGMAIFPQVDAIVRGRASWENQLGFVALIAFLHELTHLGQDLYTGIGHWDFLAREQYVSDGLQHALEIESQGVGARDEALGRLDHDLEQGLIWLPEAKVDLARRGRMAVFAALSGGSLSEGEPLLTDSLLEGEAAVTVFRTVSALKQGEIQEQIARENESFFVPASMGTTYSASREHLITCVEAAIPGSTADPKMATFYDYLFIFLVDLASAQPPPLDGAAPSRLQPGLKFQMLVQAFLALSADAKKAFMAEFVEFRFSAAESLLTRGISWWTPLTDIYSGWVEYFRANAEASAYPRIYELRALACERRATSPDQCVVKAPGRLPILPWLVLTPMGLNSGGFFDDEPLFWGIAHDVFRFNADWGAVDLLVRGQEFVCPWGEARRLCAAQGQVCTQGVTDIEALPRGTADVARWPYGPVPRPITSCGVRRSLQDIGWAFRGEYDDDVEST